MIIKSLNSFENSGVWVNHKRQNEPEFATKNLIYGFNGSGKTTLSRVFASIQRENIEEKLPDTTSFSLSLSDGQMISSESITNPFGKNLLVFNQDFVERNFEWESGSADGITYISEENIAQKETYEQSIRDYEKANSDLIDAKKSFGAAEKALKTFKTEISKRVRELAPSKRYSQSFDAKKVDRTYSERDFTDDDILTDDDLAKRQRLLGQSEPQPVLQEFSGIDFDIKAWINEAFELLEKTPGVIILEELQNHSSMLNWVDDGLKYHKEHRLESCLFCGNSLSLERKHALAGSFDTTWEIFVSKINDTYNQCYQYIQDLRTLDQNLPKEAEFQPSEHATVQPLRDEILKNIEEIGEFLKAFLVLLENKKNNPSAVISLSMDFQKFDVGKWVENFTGQVKSFNMVIKRHNTAHKEFSSQQEQAFNDIRNHVFASERNKNCEVKKDYHHAKNELKLAISSFESIRTTHDKLQNELSNHGIAAYKLNRLLADYLGHNEIKLKALDIGYELLRSDGSLAQNLSEGEKTALAFCYFLTLFKAENRNTKDLIVVIDDPVSSLDTTARTHAFSLLRRKTKNCKQTIIMTHNIEFMNMVKREFKNLQKLDATKHVTSCFFLECVCATNGLSQRSTKLVEMSSLLQNYDTEYHFLFDIVQKASQQEASCHHYLLPNATRKLLEMFASFCSPNQTSFSGALMEHHEELKDKLDIKALERLVQIESHGSINGLGNLPALTIEEAIKATKATMKFIELLEPRHYKSMKICLSSVKSNK